MSEMTVTASVFKKIIAEEIDSYTKKALKDSEKINKDSYKDATKRMKESTPKNEDKPKQPKWTPTSDNSYQRLGMERLKYDSEPTDDFKDKAKEAIVGSSRMGNKPTEGDEKENNKVFYDRVKELNKFDNEHTGFGSKNKALVQFGDDIEVLDDSEPAKKQSAYESKVKRLNFKHTIFKDENHIKNLIPEEYKKDGNVFIMRDSINNQFEITWKNNVSESTVLNLKDKEKMNEDFKRLKNLWNYNSSDFFVKSNTNNRLNEDKTVEKFIQNVRGIK